MLKTVVFLLLAIGSKAAFAAPICAVMRNGSFDCSYKDYDTCLKVEGKWACVGNRQEEAPPSRREPLIA